jgi:hypothetical protein
MRSLYRLRSAAPSSSSPLFRYLPTLSLFYSEDEGDAISVSSAKRHSSMYRDLRTNLPRQIMGFPGLRFERTGTDSRTFPHREVS